MNVYLALAKAVPASALAVTLALGVPPGIQLNLERPLQDPLGVTLALGTPRNAVVPVPALDYAAAAYLRAPPSRFQGALGTLGYDVTAGLTSAPPTLRASAGYVQETLAAAGRLRTKAPSLRAVARVYLQRISLTSGGAWTPLDPYNGLGYTFPWGQGIHVDPFWSMKWDRFVEMNVGWMPSWLRGRPKDFSATSGWHTTQRTADRSESFWWTYPPALDRSYVMSWDQFAQHNSSWAFWYSYPPAKDISASFKWLNLASYGTDLSVRMPYHYPPPKDKIYQSFPWGPGAPPDYRVRYPLPAVKEPKPTVPRGHYVCMDLKRLVPTNPHEVELALRRPTRTYCDSGSFIVNNFLNVITLVDGANLHCTAVSMALDISSFAWDITLTLATHAEYQRVKPSPAVDGAREVQITLNGYVWRGVIETVSLNREFNNGSYTAQGRSFSAYGAAPFAPKISFVSSGDVNAQQLANDAFQYSGFQINWDALDWVVPSGLFAYQDKDPMAALSQICLAAGFFILPHRYEKELTVRSRYPVTIWHWDDPETEAAAHIPLNQQISGSSRFQAGTDFTKVYVSGTEIGNTVGCTRVDTSGELLAPAVVDPLLATDDSASERGRVELCKSGARIYETLLTPIVSAIEPGVRLREVGELIDVDEFTLDDFAYKGLITSLRVTASRGANGELTAYQTMEVERHV